MKFSVLVLQVSVLLCVLFVKVLAKPTDEWFGSVDPEKLDFDNENEESKQCEWPPAPAHGYNYRSCDRGFCRDKPGALKPHGTKKGTRCYQSYILTEGEELAECKDGTWTHQSYTCTECGKSKLEDVALIHQGEKSSRGDFPWMAGLYMIKPETNKWTVVCGGTLITTHLVLTAAHCVQIKNRITEPEDLKIGLGKLFTDYYVRENNAMIKNVREIVVPERYIGFAHGYALDIALIDLDTAVTTSPYITPACIDWSGKMALTDKDTGYLAGFGLTENQTLSDTLKWSRQKYISYESCRTKVSPGDVKLVTHDKFCIVSVGGAYADHGDSGGGLTFVKNGAHHVYGIVSNRLQENFDLVLFTNLLNTEHREWVLQHWRRLRRLHNSKEEETKVTPIKEKPKAELVTEGCLGCICEATTNCKRDDQCTRDRDVCGTFTMGYWAEAGKPLFNPKDDVDDPEAFARCGDDQKCAAKAVTAYMNKFAQDCNNDGVINCHDYAAIHYLGGYGCKNKLDPAYQERFQTCFDKYGP